MRTRRRTYTAPSAVEASGTKRRKLQSCRGNRGSKCNIGLIPLDILRLILSRLGLKANIQASAVCKAWCEAAVSVRKLQPSPLLFDSLGTVMPSSWLLAIKSSFPHPSRFHPCELRFPGSCSRFHTTSCSKDGWVIATLDLVNTLLFNPFTRESFYLPTRSYTNRGCRLVFSAAPTSPSCMVIHYIQLHWCASLLINTCRPGESVWTTHRFENQLPSRTWDKCVFSNDIFYFLSTCGYLGVFDPSQATWNILPVKPCPAFGQADPVFMTEHQGDIFVIYIRDDENTNPTVLKLSSKRKEWEEKTDLGGLTIFVSYPASFVRAGPSPEHRNKIYSSFLDRCGRYGMYYSLGDAKSSDRPLELEIMTYNLVWVDPPHNNVTL